MYKPREKEEDLGAEDGDTTTLLAEDSVAADFESLKDANGPIDVDDEIDGSEIPLGKLIKRIKSKKVKGRKAEKDLSTAEVKIEDQEETNLDGVKSETENNDEKKSKRRKDSDETSDAVVPKRQRSTSKSSSSKRSAQKSSNNVGPTPEKDPLIEELLVSCTVKKHKSPISSKKLDLETKTKGGNTDKSSSETGNKRKRTSIAGSSKSSPVSNGLPTTDLVDCRIKIWWPLDKKFYEGIVKSYDPEKKKHEVLYKDGEVELLELDKERWELITKKSKLSQSPSKQGSTSKKTKVLQDSGSHESDERDTPLKYFRTQKRDVKAKTKGKFESISDTSDPKSSVAAEIDALHTGDTGVEKQASDVDSPPSKQGKNSGGDDEEMKPAIEENLDEEMEATEEEKKAGNKSSKRSQKKTKNADEDQSPKTICADEEPIGNWFQQMGKPKPKSRMHK